MATAMDIAETMLGKGEVPDRATIQEYLKNGGANLDPVTTAWCAAYVNSSLAQAGLEGTGSNLARSFLKYGTPVEQPQRGDIAVFTRGDPNGWQGHVGFFDSLNPDGTIRVLGGNQSDRVSYANYPAGRLLGYRRPEPGPQPPGSPAPPITKSREVQDRPIVAMQQSQPPAQAQARKDAAGGLGAVLASLAPLATSGIQKPQIEARGPGEGDFGSGDPMGATMAAMQGSEAARRLRGTLLPDIEGLMSLGGKGVRKVV